MSTTDFLQKHQTMNQTSFKKRTKSKLVSIKGTKPSVQNNQLLVSCGAPSIDFLFGGGLAVGTTLLIEEDCSGSYSEILLKYFISEGVVSQHQVCVVSIDQHAAKLVKNLPKPILDNATDTTQQQQTKAATDKQQTTLAAATGDADMKIAWRYKHLPQQTPVVASSSDQLGHYYDLNTTMDPAMVSCAQPTHFTPPHTPATHSNNCQHSNRSCMLASFQSVLDHIQLLIEEGGYSTAAPPPAAGKRNILRIAIHSLCSPLWGEIQYYDVSRFLLTLRAILRSAYATACITLPMHLYKGDSTFVSAVEHLSDTVVHLDSFTGTSRETNPVFKEYHGLFHIKKLPTLNALHSHMPETLDLAFKLKRKRFTVEKLCLPPDLSDTASRDQREAPLSCAASAMGATSSAGTGAAPLLPAALDF